MKLNYKLLFCFTILLSTLNVILANNEVSDRELIALLELRARTNGNTWTNAWDLETPVSQWYGVRVSNGKVVSLDLSNNNLQGNLPLTVGNLTNLEYLDLSNNQLSGRMPRELRKFNNLKYLDLSGNQFKGTVPATLHKMNNLAYLNLGSNKFEGELPQTLIELENLNSLALADNNFSGNLPAGMEKLKKLQKLTLSNNKFESLESLRTLAQQQIVLTDVEIKNNKFGSIDFTKTTNGTAELKFEDELE